MRLNRFIFLVASTVLLGALTGVATSVTGWWVHVYWYTGIIEGGFLATTCLMGFWAYLTLNFIARVTLPLRVWRWTQGLLIVLAMYDMLWLRYHNAVMQNPQHHTVWLTYLIEGLWPLLVALATAAIKVRLSGRGSYLPSVFFLYVFTVIDWLLVIWFYAGPVAEQTGLVMMVCNVYMLLVFGKLLNRDALALEAPRESLV